jgi:3-hydroxyacyl-CoA dehydrogenase
MSTAWMTEPDVAAPSPSIASRQVRKVAVLGAGTMGSRIAAHIANAGVPVVLLDIVPPGTSTDAAKAIRTQLAIAAVEALKKTKPAAFYAPDAARLITPGNFEDDLALLAGCDWIIEAVAEDLDIKHALLTRVDADRDPASIVTTNTSGLSIEGIVSGLSDGLRRHWFGTHFFNPPRYMRLLEIVATPDTDPAAIATIARFCDVSLGKSIVHANDTPNFIANRIGTFSVATAIRLMMDQGLTIEEVDTLTGSPLGWPKTGTFRLADLVGIDVLAHVATNFAAHPEAIQDQRVALTLAPFLDAMIQRRWLGDKTRQGFYRKLGKDEQGRDLREVLDWQSLDYKPSMRPRFPALDMAKNVEKTALRLPQLLTGDPKSDKAAAFYRPFLAELVNYAANRLAPCPNPIAASIVEIDEAMRAGYNWELGPFEIFDAIGVRAACEIMRSIGIGPSPNVDRLLAAEPHNPTWYRDDPTVPSGRAFFDPVTRAYHPVPFNPGTSSLASIKKSHGVVRKNAGASVIDLGDGVAAIELHSKMNALGDDIVSLIAQTLKPASAQVADFEAFVITGDAANFSVGANLMDLLLSIQDEEWDEIDLAVRAIQNMTQAIKFCPRPVVVAPFGLCLGGGVEMALHAAARHPHAELYMGLVETGVGLVPGGGGCKEMLLRSIEAGTGIRPDVRGEGVELFEALKKNFETIAMAKTSASAAEARSLGFLRPSDLITISRPRLLCDAKATARQLADAVYLPPQPQLAIPAPGVSVLATLKLAVYTLREGKFISDHDAKVANHAAHILCGGTLNPGTPVSEQYILDLERQAFLSLCGEKKTQERIAFTLKTGKPLRN